MASLTNVWLVVFCAFLGSCNQPLSPVTKPLQSTAAIPDSCPVTKRPEKPFVPPPPWGDVGDDSKDPYFSYGNDRLWVELPRNGMWKELKLNYAPIPAVYSQGVLWGRIGYDRLAEPHPKLQVTGKRLDAKAPGLVARRAEGCCRVFDGPEPPSEMSVLLNLPTLGCWEITGRYEGEALTFVIWATDQN